MLQKFQMIGKGVNVMVVNEKALVREMKEAYKGWGYTVMVLPGDRWVIKASDDWIVMIEDQDNVPNEVLALIVLHMGYLPKPERCYRIYKGDKCVCIQKEVYKVEAESFTAMAEERRETDDAPVVVRRTALHFGRRRVWQQTDNNRVLLINPRYEGLMDAGGDKVIRAVGNSIYLDGEISCVYISRSDTGAKENLLNHLAQVSWT